MKLLSVSVPDTRGLYSVHLMPFFELEFFLFVSIIGCFADKFVDGKPYLGAMLVHVFSSGAEITDESYSQQSQTIKPLYCYNNLTRQQGNCIF